MSNIKRIDFLETEHRRINQLIDKNPARLDIHELKKKRLAYRDELAKLKEQQWNQEQDRLEWD